MITESPTGIITDNLELTADRDAPALLTATAKTKNPIKNNNPNPAPKKNVPVEYCRSFSDKIKIRLITEAVK